LALESIVRVAVIVPAYQCGRTIENVLGGIPAWVDAIYVVDDASLDDTSSRVRAVADPRVRLIVHDVNRGVGGAMMTGYRAALDEHIDVFVKMDADNQMDPGYLRELVEPLLAARADYAKGNRFTNSAALQQMPVVRRVGNVGLSFLVRAASGQWHVFDPTNGYTAIHRAALAALPFRSLDPRYFFESSMLIALRLIGAVVEDVPIPCRYGDEVSHLPIGRTLLRFPWLLLRKGAGRILAQYFVRDFTPISLLLVCGVPLVAFGALFGLYHWITSYFTHRLTSTGTVMVAVLPFMLGVQFLLQAFILDIQTTPLRALQARGAKRSGAAPEPHERVVDRA
jgi:dolichol-phosphate mannosyltransferase